MTRYYLIWFTIALSSSALAMELSPSEKTKNDFKELKRAVIKDLHELADETEQYIGTIYQTVKSYTALSPCLICCYRYYDACISVFPESKEPE